MAGSLLSAKDNTPVEKEAPKTASTLSSEKIRGWLAEARTVTGKKTCLVLGRDHSGKSGLVLDYLAKGLREDENACAVVLDLDQGFEHLLEFYPDVADRIIVKDPTIFKVNEEDAQVELKYATGMALMRGVAFEMKKNPVIKIGDKELTCKYFTFDGISTFLKFCERQMRLDKNLDASGDPKFKFWMVRNQQFEETIKIIKSLDMDTFFIGHEDFILDSDSAAIKQQCNAMMNQRIICNQKLDVTTGDYTLIAHIQKARARPEKVNQKIPFMKLVHAKDKTIKQAFKSDRVWDGL